MADKHPGFGVGETGLGPEPFVPNSRPQGPDAGALEQAQARALVRLNEQSTFLWRTRSLQEGLEASLSSAIDLVGADGGLVRLLDPAREVLTIAVQQGFDQDTLDTFEGVSAAAGSEFEGVLRAAERITVEDVKSGTDFAIYREIARSSGFRSLQSTPLIGRDGEALGVITTHWRAPHRLSETDWLTLDLCARQMCDFVERCRADETLRNAHQVAYRLAAIVESSDDAIVSKDLNGIITSWNAGAERLFGYLADEAVGTSVTMIIPPERQGEEPRILERIRRGENIRHFETVRRRKDGTLVDISLTVSPVKDSQGRIIGASKIARDISERKLAEQHRELLVAELSHRVKNTLATVMSIARHSFHQGMSVDAARTSFEKRLQALANNHGRLAVSGWSGVPLDEIFHDELSPYGDGKNTRLSGPPVFVKARYALPLGMAAHELATNAAKYGALSAEGGAIAVEWKTDRRRGQLQIRWSETGGPITEPPESRGFGRLLIERALAADLGGDVDMDFAAAGLKCTIRIPIEGCVMHRADGEEPHRSPDRAGPAAARPPRDSARTRILVVEDEFLLASVLTNDLASAGYSVIGPYMSLEPAQAGSRGEEIDLAILDINLGDETIYPLADEFIRRKMPFILLTCLDPNDLPQRFRRLPLVAKPYDAPVLLSTIEQLISPAGKRASGMESDKLQ